MIIIHLGSDLLVQMLRVHSLAGKQLATFSSDEQEGKTVQQLKVAVAKEIGVTRFQQKWLSEQGIELHDEAIAPPGDVQVVVLPFVPAEPEEQRQLLVACRRNRLEEVHGFLARPWNPDGAHFVVALHIAAQHGHSEIVRVLLDCGIDKDAADAVDDEEEDDLVHPGDGTTALHLAAANGHLDVVQALLEVGADKFATTKDGKTVLHLAAESGYFDVVELLIKAAGGANRYAATMYGATSLHMAAYYGYGEVVRVLLAGGADVAAAMQDGRTPVHHAADNGHSEVVKLLLEARVDKDAAMSDGTTALHVAADRGRRRVVEVLLQSGADIEATMHDGRTALDEAADKGHREIGEMLFRVMSRRLFKQERS